MNRDLMPSGGNDPEPTRFSCGVCGTPLIVPGSKAGVSGPCPKCMDWIDTSELVAGDTPATGRRTELPPFSPALRRRHMQPVTGGKCRVRADGYPDHEYNDRHELYGTLRFIAVSLAVMAVILFVALYLRHWAGK